MQFAMKLKTSPARLAQIVAQLLQPSLAFCFSSQTMAAYRPGAVIGCKLKQNANEGFNSCTNLAGLVLCFIARFILLVIGALVILACFSAQIRRCDSGPPFRGAAIPNGVAKPNLNPDPEPNPNPTLRMASRYYTVDACVLL